MSLHTELCYDISIVYHITISLRSKNHVKESMTYSELESFCDDPRSKKWLEAQFWHCHRCSQVLDRAKWSSGEASRSCLKCQPCQHWSGRQRQRLQGLGPMKREHRLCSSLRIVGCKELQAISPQPWGPSCSNEVRCLWTLSSLLVQWFEPPLWTISLPF